jgi:intracellular sulfur oxidation DsrE/DsrF family protein
MNTMRSTILAMLAAVLLPWAGAGAAAADEPVKAVYHVPDDQNAMLAMMNAANHLAADPSAKIVVVALSRGVKAFVFGAQDATGKPYADWVEQLTARGVEFRMCQNTMTALKIAKSDLVDKVQVVPSGVAEIARLQAREGFVYVRP